MSMPQAHDKDGTILRLRAGFLLLAALLLLCLSGGTFLARQFQLGYGWALLIALVIAAGVGYGVFRLTNKAYLAIAVLVTLVTAYFAYDFLRNAMGWSAGLSLTFALVPLVVVGAAFWDFRRLKVEIRTWLNSR